MSPIGKNVTIIHIYIKIPNGLYWYSKSKVHVKCKMTPSGSLDTGIAYIDIVLAGIIIRHPSVVCINVKARYRMFPPKNVPQSLLPKPNLGFQKVPVSGVGAAGEG